MRIIIAPQSLKGSLTAAEAGQAIAAGVEAVYPEAEIDIVPIADGGEGTVQALVDATGGEIVQHALDDVDAQLVAGADLVAQPIDAIERDQIAAVDRVAKEDARIELRDDSLDAGRVQRDWGMLARGTATEVLAGDDDLVR